MYCATERKKINFVHITETIIYKQLFDALILNTNSMKLVKNFSICYNFDINIEYKIIINLFSL